MIRPTDLTINDIKVIIEKTIGYRLLMRFPVVLSTENVERIKDRSGGSPYHAAILATGLKNSLLAGRFTGVQDLPAGVDSLAISRFDALHGRDQVVIKIASIIGSNFTKTDLSGVLKEHAKTETKDYLDETLARLVGSMLIVPETKNDKENFRFPDRAVQESIYNLMLTAQRERFHGVVAKYFERTQQEEKFDDIVHHYVCSDVDSKKIEYLQRSVEAATFSHSHTVAYQHLGKLIKLATGFNEEELLGHKLAHGKQQASLMSRVLSFFSHSSSKMNKIAIASQEGEQLHLIHTNRWLSAADFVRRHLIIHKENIHRGVPFHSLVRWIAELGLVEFM